MTKSSPSIWCLLSKCQIDGEDFVNFCGLLRKHELYHVSTKWIWDYILLLLDSIVKQFCGIVLVIEAGHWPFHVAVVYDICISAVFCYNCLDISLLEQTTYCSSVSKTNCFLRNWIRHFLKKTLSFNGFVELVKLNT